MYIAAVTVEQPTEPFSLSVSNLTGTNFYAYNMRGTSKCKNDRFSKLAYRSVATWNSQASTWRVNTA